MLYSKVEEILEKSIKDVEELKGIEDKFHSIEREIDDMANKPDADLDKIIDRAEILITRVFRDFQGSSAWITGKWTKIEHDIRENLRELK